MRFPCRRADASFFDTAPMQFKNVVELNDGAAARDCPWRSDRAHLLPVDYQGRKKKSAVPEHRLALGEKGMHAFMCVLAGKARMELSALEADAFQE